MLTTAARRYNIDPFDAHTDEEVWRALERANLKKKVTGVDEEESYRLPVSRCPATSWPC